ncbi:hypothetical protein TRFO_32533 [Tritrichomonas foetus]|uniref:Mon2/Sec7/BIG1-like dimerisation and cyclophilin-binding domain-containing protein n=1 Tax=Tritrichomonas foetus TaxID=1144522 RepID=A0A1J4JNK2_9EUKA|nr:hypothetical protein TRFO_32533 [Tritrichomonas foetus]|eukprot:OHT00711.1 hypothetical protein TRFO_32533 [Tritrichomonas foetus]
MQKTAIHQLRDELSKLTGFLIAAPVKSAASQALTFLNQKSNQYPITTPDSPLISAFTAFFANNKIIKNFNQLILRLIDCIKNNIFAKDALVSVMNNLCINFSLLDVEPCLKILQYTTSAILYDFPDIYIIKSFFSISLSLLASPNPVISGTAYASFQQMLTLLTDTILQNSNLENNSENNTENQKKNQQNILTVEKYNSYLELCKKEYSSVVNGFKNPLFVILHLLYCDLSNLSQNLTPNWLFCVNPPPDALFVLLSEIVETYNDILKSDHQLFSSFQLSIFEFVKFPNSIPYLITYLDAFLELDNSIGSTIVSEFFQKIQYNAESNYAPIFFFHYFALQKSDLMLRYFTECEGALSLFVPLFCTFINYLNIPPKSIHFQMKQWKHSEILLNPSEYEIMAIHEITFALLNSFKKSDDKNVIEFMNKSIIALSSLVVSGVKYSDIDSFSIPQQGLIDLCQIFYRINQLGKIEDKFQKFDQLFIGFKEKQKKLFFFDEKRRRVPSFLYKIVLESPDICEDRWQYYLSDIINSDVKLSPSFANNFSDITTMDILHAIVNVRPFPCQFLTEFIISNVDRFVIIWPVVESFIDKIFRRKTPGYEDLIFEFLILLLKKCFTQKSEVELLRMASTFLHNEISLSHKNALIHQLKENVTSKASEIKEGWISLFAAISPQNFTGTITQKMDTVNSDFYKELIKIGFDIINYVACDYVDANSVPQCIDTIFSYIEQQIDDSVSLFGFDLLMKISKRVESWDIFINRCANIFNDSREKVAETSVTTFFNILQKNYVSDQTITNLIEFGFLEILNQFNDDSFILSKVLTSIVEYSCKNWETFEEIPDFYHFFIPRLIEKQQKSTHNFVKFYTIFYNCSKTTPEIEKLLCRSIDFRITQFLDNSNHQHSKTPNANLEMKNDDSRKENSKSDSGQSQNYQSSEEEIKMSLDLLKLIISQKFVKISIRNWMPVIVKIFLILQANHIKVVLDSILSLFPPTDINEGQFIVEQLSSIVSRSESSDTRKLLVQTLLNILEKNPMFIWSCKHAFSTKEATNELLPKLLNYIEQVKENENSNPNGENFSEANPIFECLSLALNSNLDNEHLKSQILQKIIELFPTVPKDARHHFLLSHSNDYETITSIFNLFFDIRSKSFNERVFEECKNVAKKVVHEFFSINQNDQELKGRFMNFLQNMETKDDEGKCGQWLKNEIDSM